MIEPRPGPDARSGVGPGSIGRPGAGAADAVPRPGADPAELVPGNPEQVELLATRLRRLAARADAAARLTRVDLDHWSGEAAELFKAAVGPLPAELERAATAFAAAARALSTYAAVLANGQAAAARAIRQLEQSTVDAAAGQRSDAAYQVEQARAEVAAAARAAATTMARAAADAPVGGLGGMAGGSASGVAVRTGNGTIRLHSRHELSEPAGYVAPLGDLAEQVRYGTEHVVGFAGAGIASGAAHSSPPSWAQWVTDGGGRGMGDVTPGVLAQVGLAGGGAAAAGAGVLLGRRRRNETALATAGLTDDELRRRRERFAAGRRGERDALTAGRRTSTDSWRTHVASGPRSTATVHAWVGADADPLPRTRGAAPVPLPQAGREVRGAVLHNGPPTKEQPAGPGAPR